MSLVEQTPRSNSFHKFADKLQVGGSSDLVGELDRYRTAKACLTFGYVPLTTTIFWFLSGRAVSVRARTD